MTDKIVTYNVVVLPDEKVRRQVIFRSEQISKKFQTKFTLDGNKFHPHITLYQAAYPESNIEQIKQRLTKIASNTTLFQITLTKIESFMQFIFLNAVKSRELFDLHKLIIDALNPLREGTLIPDDEEDLQNPETPQQVKDSILRYGYSLALEAFAPHITLSRLKNGEDVEKALDSIAVKPYTFTVDAMYLTNRGQNGTCNEIFARFPFAH
ncbi:2'-5' RNA ligase family protein [Candidatus Microgenomates bacterium]|nr:MAG: 2'-5' RNA ligase family protein [Candidatus Microgenomates bacterium]